LPARLELVQAPEGDDHPLADLAADAPALGDLEIDAPAGDLPAEVHRRSHVGAYTIALYIWTIKQNPSTTWHYDLGFSHS
jgi:hypothetical protein